MMKLNVQAFLLVAVSVLADPPTPPSAEQPDTLCTDKDVSCSSWAKDGECLGENSLHVSSVCPASCNICSPGCHDKSASCTSWAIAGECAKNPGYMLEACPLRCPRAAAKTAHLS